MENLRDQEINKVEIRKSIKLRICRWLRERTRTSWSNLRNGFCSEVWENNQPCESRHMEVEHVTKQTKYVKICQNKKLLNEGRGNKIWKEDIPYFKQIQSLTCTRARLKIVFSNRKWPLLFILVLQRGPLLRALMLKCFQCTFKFEPPIKFETDRF